MRMALASVAGFGAFWLFLLVVFSSLNFFLQFIGSAIGATIVMVFVWYATKALTQLANRPPAADRCPACGGAGWVKTPAVDATGRSRGDVLVSCMACHMTGRRTG